MLAEILSSYHRRGPDGVVIDMLCTFGAAPALAQEPETFDQSIAAVTVNGPLGGTVPVTLQVSSNGPQTADRMRTAVIERPAGTEFAGP